MTTAITTGTDFTQFTALRAAAERDDAAVLGEVAAQFESLFLQTMLKNMRAGQLAEPLFGSDQHDMYQDMMDQQMAIEMSRGQGIGFADMLVRQLGDGAHTPPPRIERVSPPVRVAGAPEVVTVPPPGWSTPQAFAADVWPHVEATADRLGVAPEAVLAQAALETGWGEHVMRYADGANSLNLFGIKAGEGWFGGSVVKQTLEFSGGVPEVVRARFRAYPDVASTFNDYTKLLTENPRYAAVLQRGHDVRGFAEALKAAGYATDPNYAEKIVRIADSPTLTSTVRALKDSGAPPMTIDDAALSVR